MTAHRWFARLACPAAVGLCLAAGQIGSAQSPPTVDLLTALVEPSLQDDGRLSPEERQAIRQVARKLLNAEQLRELETRLGGADVTPVASTTIIPVTDAPPANTESFVIAGSPAEDARWFENLSFLVAMGGAKQPQDLGLNAHMGGRLEVNYGFPLLEQLGIGGQIGTGYDFRDNAVNVLAQVQGTNDSYQNYTTAGVFQRTEWGLDWALAYDFRYDRYWDHMHLGQWRGQVGYHLRPQDELGIWFTVEDRGDRASFLGVPFDVEPLSQANFYWRRTWDNQAQTTAWIGMAEGHGRDVFSISTEPPTDNVLTYGAEIFVPLNDLLAIYGAATFHTPADSGTVDAYLGVAFYPGGAYGGRSRRFAPLLPVADNPFFAADLRR